MPRPVIQPVGDSAFMVDVGDEIDPSINQRVRIMAAQVASRLAAYERVEVIPAYGAFMVSFDPSLLEAEVVEVAIQESSIGDVPTSAGYHRFIIPVTYGGEYGPDLDELASMHGLTIENVIALHSERDYPIYCLGFSPGFPFLGGLDDSLITPRLDTPRSRVPAGSVAIGGSQTGVYPTESPGGWRLIGRTPASLFDAHRTPPVPYRAGDVIRFVPISPIEYQEQVALKVMPVGVAVET